jgi:hypothetical protein
MKIKKTQRKYKDQRMYVDTNLKLQKLSKKQGKYIIEILESLVNAEFDLYF